MILNLLYNDHVNTEAWHKYPFNECGHVMSIIQYTWTFLPFRLYTFAILLENSWKMLRMSHIYANIAWLLTNEVKNYCFAIQVVRCLEVMEQEAMVNLYEYFLIFCIAKGSY